MLVKPTVETTRSMPAAFAGLPPAMRMLLPPSGTTQSDGVVALIVAPWPVSVHPFAAGSPASPVSLKMAFVSVHS